MNTDDINSTDPHLDGFEVNDKVLAESALRRLIGASRSIGRNKFLLSRQRDRSSGSDASMLQGISARLIAIPSIPRYQSAQTPDWHYHSYQRA